MVDFLTCLGCKQWWWACLRKIGFCIHFPFIYLPFGTPFVYFLYTLGFPRAFLVVNIFLAFTHKKIIQFMELIQGESAIVGKRKLIVEIGEGDVAGEIFL